MASPRLPDSLQAVGSAHRRDTVEAICKAVKIPVYALGGVTPKTISQLQDVPIKGVALMSGLMTCPDVPGYLKELRA